jgi:hypothetical protein
LGSVVQEQLIRLLHNSAYLKRPTPNTNGWKFTGIGMPLLKVLVLMAWVQCLDSANIVRSHHELHISLGRKALGKICSHLMPNFRCHSPCTTLIDVAGCKLDVTDGEVKGCVVKRTVDDSYQHMPCRMSKVKGSIT